jgi:hypothetical protein
MANPETKLTVRVTDAGTLKVFDDINRRLDEVERNTRDVSREGEKVGQVGASAFSRFGASVVTANQALELAGRLSRAAMSGIQSFTDTADSMKLLEGRLRLVSRFDKRMIAAIRALDRETMDTILFPEQSEEAQARLKIFWGQRDRLLKRVDALVKEHGEEAVYAF